MYLAKLLWKRRWTLCLALSKGCGSQITARTAQHIRGTKCVCARWFVKLRHKHTHTCYLSTQHASSHQPEKSKWDRRGAFTPHFFFFFFDVSFPRNSSSLSPEQRFHPITFLCRRCVHAAHVPQQPHTWIPSTQKYSWFSPRWPNREAGKEA